MTFDADKVRDVAATQLDDDPEGGAALCVVLDGVEVLHETWGPADAESGTPYTPDTLQITQSMGKGVVGAVAALLISRGQLHPDERVASYWPEFGTPDKRAITVAQLLSHQAGLVYLDDGMPLALTTDRARLADALTAQSPAWEPGTEVGYSPQLVGNYADFLFEHATGKGFGDLLGELTAMLQLEMYVGLPREHRHRAARVLAAPQQEPATSSPELDAALADPDSLLMRVMRNIPEATSDPIAMCNSDAIYDAFMPAANMFSNARAFAHLYDALGRTASGATSELWSRDVVDLVTSECVRGTDVVTTTETAFALAFQKPNTTYPFARSPRAFGHGGAGGSLAMADPDAGLAMCWIPTRYSSDAYDHRETAIVDALYSALT